MSLALSNLARVGAIVGGCNAVGYGLTAAFETHKLTDLVGAGSFVAATLAMSYKNGLLNVKAGGVMHPKLLLVNVGVILWGSRLASFLFSRVLKVGEDKRLQKFFRKPGEGFLDIKASFFPVRLATFWTIQAAWGFICLLPVTLYNSVPLMLSDGRPNPQFLLKSAHGPVATCNTTFIILESPFRETNSLQFSIYAQCLLSFPSLVSFWVLASKLWLTGKRTHSVRTRRMTATGVMWVFGE